MKLYSLQYDWYWLSSYHVIANSREEALKIIQWHSTFIFDVGSYIPKIYESYEDCRKDSIRSGYYLYYWEERDIGEVLVTEPS